jgi:hypothetical protein
MAEIELGDARAGDYILTWFKDDVTNKHTITLTKTEINPDLEATTNLAIDTKVKSMTYTE